MPRRITLNAPLNRVEGDLELKVEIEDGVVRDAWASSTLYRGIESLLLGRAALDGLVITPRVCGICSTAHLTAAVQALDSIAGATPPADAVRLRNAALLCELVQSDVRQPFLMFACDLAGPAYEGAAWIAEARRRWAPFVGETAREVIRETKKLLEVVAIIGGQWPHSSFMVPGGIASLPSDADQRQCRMLVDHFRTWYERRILGCSLERWHEVRSGADLERWLSEGAHAEGDLGALLQLMRQAGLDGLGGGHASFLSAGGFPLPEGSAVQPLGEGRHLIPAGFLHRGERRPFAPEHVAEHVAASWYSESAHLPPAEGRTEPYASGNQGARYSFAKAPRYEGHPAETGPLAELLIAGHPLFLDLVRERTTVLARELARAVRPAYLLPALEAWLTERGDGRTYAPPGEIREGAGCGVLQATRGFLGHWVRIEEGLIRSYQMVAPTGWNASPRDAGGVRGPIEEAMIGVRLKDPANPIELGHVARSFDPCLVCTVHALSDGRALDRVTLEL
ncbi:MAG: nickel-dependent hydrogenase large subunit [Deltaproteobacteria bacterium]|nr:nickel-dependent hydrogenase large subunit [Deltaproteobacteria bacterium]